MPYKLRVAPALALRILRKCGDKDERIQSDEWLALMWQRMKPWRQERLVDAYLKTTKESI